MKKIGVLTSGGDSPGMNAAVRAITRFGIAKGMRVYGIYRGYEGLIDGDIQELNRRDVGDILQRGGTMLKTARSERFMTEEGRRKALMTIETFGLNAIIVIGGNGSFAGALELSKLGVNVMCIPGTIDNDLSYTDMTIGFDTAVNTVLEAITRIRDTSSSHERTTVIEVMGRHCGDIALYAGIAGGAEAVLLPEEQKSVKDVCRKIIEGNHQGKQHSIIIKAEGYPMDSQELVKEIGERTGRPVRLVVLSYLQRGGSPTLQDRLLATRCGDKAIEFLEAGLTNKAIGQLDGQVMGFDLAQALEVERQFDHHMYESVEILSQ